MGQIVSRIQADRITFVDYEAYEAFCNALNRVFGSGVKIDGYLDGSLISANFSVDLDKTFWTPRGKSIDS